jgi:hypothetical protein
MKRPIPIVTIMGLVLSLCGEGWAASAGVAMKSGGATPGVARQTPVVRDWRSSRYVVAGYPYPYYYYPYGHFYSPVIVVSPYYSPYYVPPTVVVTSPFFCVLHQVGYVSRAGMLDHLAGTHKFALETAASVCPDGAAHCIFPSY